MSSTTRPAEGSFTGEDGTALRWIAWGPAGPPRATLMVVHGLADHAERYAPLGGELARAGISTFAFDLRGHGRSPGPRGHAASFTMLLHDLDRFRQFVAGRVGAAVPLFLLGHSMGGLICLRYLQAGPRGLHGAIFSAPWLATAVPVPGWKRLPAVLLERIAPSLPVPAGLDPSAISDEAAAVEAYRTDPLVHGRISPRLFREAERAAAAARDETALHVPAALFLLPADDRIIDPAATRALAHSVTGAAVTVREWAPAGHELLNSSKRGEVVDVIREWLLRHLEP